MKSFCGSPLFLCINVFILRVQAGCNASAVKERRRGREQRGWQNKGPRHLLRYIMIMLQGEDKIWRSRSAAWSLHLSPEVSGWAGGMTTGPGDWSWRIVGSLVRLLGTPFAGLCFYHRGQINSKWGVIFLKSIISAICRALLHRSWGWDRV